VKLLHRFWANEDGADATEYALLAGLIAMAIVGGATSMGTSWATLSMASPPR
jgi:pilus assembly protein Flp/PilA